MSATRVNIDHRGPVPLHAQLKEILQNWVESGQLARGERMPSERELCERFHVSRTTVRQALAQAEREGLLVRIHGKGTFVAPPKIAQPLVQITGFAETIRARGQEPSMRVLGVRTVPADVALAALLGTEAGAPLTEMSTLGLADGEPMVLYISHLPPGLGPQVVERARERAGQGQSFTMYELYGEILGLKVVNVQQTFEAVPADEATARILHLRKGAPVFAVTSLVRDDGGNVLEHRRASYRGDKYRFNVQRQYHL
ncbi:MAG: GntR family transcriptional regulator [Bacillota bacterium]|nr:GntR family transcriptional regulator [Bacillota bacterium]